DRLRLSLGASRVEFIRTLQHFVAKSITINAVAAGANSYSYGRAFTIATSSRPPLGSRAC
ncbi:MAG: hypothetical protein ACXWC1_33560, partial [Burkholderiales bacterium]